MDNKIHLLVSTNGGTVFDGQVNYVLLPLEGGEYGILSGHAPLMGALAIGVVKYKIDDQADYIAVTGGVVSVNEDEVILLTRSAEQACDINMARAEAAEQRALQRMADGAGHWNQDRLQLALQRSLVRKKAHDKFYMK